MGRSAFVFLIGVATGALSVALYTRVRESLLDEDAEALVERLAEQLDRLERAEAEL